jgi:hypothetical protein
MSTFHFDSTVNNKKSIIYIGWLVSSEEYCLGKLTCLCNQQSKHDRIKERHSVGCCCWNNNVGKRDENDLTTASIGVNDAVSE